MTRFRRSGQRFQRWQLSACLLSILLCCVWSQRCFTLKAGFIQASTYRKRRRSFCPSTRSFATLQTQNTEIAVPPVIRSSELHPKDIIKVTIYTFSCFLTACLICAYEDYECSHLKSEVTTLRPSSTLGMAFGESDRLSERLVTSPSIPSYNEIMLKHRTDRVNMWKEVVSNEQQQKEAIHSVKAALNAVLELKRLADDYAWDDMRQLIRQPALTSQLDWACAVLRTHPPSHSTLSSAEVSSEIGFEWGSCAWRYCGAHADAQEALAELYNLLGVLEPYECRFVLDIIERSLRDILAVSDPDNTMETPAYQPYVPAVRMCIENSIMSLTVFDLSILPLCLTSLMHSFNRARSLDRMENRVARWISTLSMCSGVSGTIWIETCRLTVAKRSKIV
jgi:hypothetical protein